jgi:pimeloyl-ACP methyl ester carboxylesterase
MKILSLSGFAQQPEILNQYLDNCQDIDFMKLNYSELENKIIEFKPDIIIGWSIGAMIALKISQKIKVKKLILISGFKKFISDSKTQANFDNLKKILNQDKEKFLNHFTKLIYFADSNAKEIKSKLNIINNSEDNLKYWFNFLEQEQAKIETKNIGQSLIIHGDKDIISNSENSSIMKNELGNSSLEIFKDSSHCPFFSQEDKFKQIINEFINN